MQTFEFHFNPKTKPDLIFDSFCFEPANVYEKKAGSLYMAGLLKNALPAQGRFLDNLAKIVRERYYKFTLKSPEKALKESLKSTNEYLERIAKSGDVSWLGNLSFAILSLKNCELNFTKVGDIKIILLRKGQIIDIDKRLKFQDLEPYPLKVFPNIVSGKLTENDTLLLLTKDVFHSFASQNLLTRLAEASSQGHLEGKQLKELFQKKTAELSKIFGTCLLIHLGRSKEETISNRQIISPGDNKALVPPRLKEFSFKAVFLPIFHLPLRLSRNPVIILTLAVFLGLGFLISRREENQKLNFYKAELNQIREKTKNTENASMFIEAWEEISSLTKIVSRAPKDFQKQALSLRDEISGNLFRLNKMVNLAEPELILEINPDQLIPQRIVSDGNDIYLFSPYSPKLAKASLNGKLDYYLGEKLNSAAQFNDSLLFFSKPASISVGTADGFSKIQLSLPAPDSNLEQFTSFNSNLYFLDRQTEKIVKYSYAGGFRWGEPEDWTQNKITDDRVKSLAVDGSIWILRGNNGLARFYAGRLRETLEINIFPKAKDFSKILIVPSQPYFYLLEPNQNRVVILFNKSGQIFKQFQSEKFDNLLDFSVTENGLIYLLNGQKVYKISE